MANSVRHKDITQLGMSTGKARNLLVNIVLLSLAQQAGVAICFRCEQPLTESTDLSIDHKVPWRGEDTSDLYWAVENLALSHKKCNTVDRPARKLAPEGHSWCSVHKRFHLVEEFGLQTSRWNRLATMCLEAGREKAARYDARTPRVKCPECDDWMRKTCQSCGYDMPMKDYMAMRRREGVRY